MNALRYRPERDWWQAAGRRFDSTAALLEADLPSDSTVTYHFQARPDTAGGTVPGALRKVAGHVFFAPDQSQQVVDLSLYRQAQPPPEPELDARPVWQDSLAGAAAGVVLPATILIPVVGVFVPASLGVTAGKRAAGRSGAFLGGAAGVAAAATTVVLGQAGLVGVAAASALSGLAGAVAGPYLMPRLRLWEAHVEQVKDQWWAPYDTDYGLKPDSDTTRRELVELAAGARPAGTGVVEGPEHVQVGGSVLRKPRRPGPN